MLPRSNDPSPGSCGVREVRRLTPYGALVVALALSVSACGGEDATATDHPTRSTSASVTPTPTPTPAPTPAPTVAPLSPFEDRAPVKALRVWDAAAAQTVNARERSLASLAPLTTARGLGQMKSFTSDDLAKGYLLPGPHPFTPVDVQVHGGVAKVSACFQITGWSTYRKTGKPVRKRKIVGVVLEVRKVSGVWKFDQWHAADEVTCRGVVVKAVRW